MSEEPDDEYDYVLFHPSIIIAVIGALMIPLYIVFSSPLISVPSVVGLLWMMVVRLRGDSHITIVKHTESPDEMFK